MKSLDILTASIYLTLLLFYVPVLFYIRAKANQQRAQRRFFRGLLSIIENAGEDEDRVSEVGMLYKRLTETHIELTKNFRSPSELIEELIVLIDTLEDKLFKDRFRMEKPASSRPALCAVLKELKERSPYASLSSKESNLLSSLATAIESGNKDLAKNAISQLADELELSGANLRNQERKNAVSFLVSVVSVALTIFFGIVSLIPLFRG